MKNPFLDHYTYLVKTELLNTRVCKSRFHLIMSLLHITARLLHHIRIILARRPAVVAVIFISFTGQSGKSLASTPNHDTISSFHILSHERYWWAVNPPVLYSGGTSLKFRYRNRVAWLKFSWFFSVSSPKYLDLGDGCFFPIPYPLEVSSFVADILRASLNKPDMNK
jgi:hypothetical protein